MIEMGQYMEYLRGGSSTVAAQSNEYLRSRRFSRRSTSARVANCTGLAARDLVPDPEVFALRGPKIVVRNPGINAFFIEGPPGPDGSSFHPHGDIVVLGGSAHVSDDTTPDPAELAAIVDRCAAVDPRLRDAEVLEHRVGLRPGRGRSASTPRTSREVGSCTTTGTWASVSRPHGDVHERSSVSSHRSHPISPVNSGPATGRCLCMATGDHEHAEAREHPVLAVDVDGLGDLDIVDIGALVQLQLVARRFGASIELCNARGRPRGPPEVHRPRRGAAVRHRELHECVGHSEVREQVRVDEEVDPVDPAVGDLEHVDRPRVVAAARRRPGTARTPARRSRPSGRGASPRTRGRLRASTGELSPPRSHISYGGIDSVASSCSSATSDSMS